MAWPIFSWGDDHFAVRPLFSVYKQSYLDTEFNEFNFLWPVCQFDTENNDHRIFPFFWGKTCGETTYFDLFPALWWNRTFAGVFPFFWSRKKSNSGFCIFPLFWVESSSGTCWNTLWPLYYYESFEKSDTSTPSDQSEFWALCYLAGYNRKVGEFTDHRFLPFYLWVDGNFFSLPYSVWREPKTDFMRRRILCGLAGINHDGDGKYDASWLFPLYYHDNKKLITPLFGAADDSFWLLPLYYRDADSFVTPIYGRICDADWIFPLFYRDSESFVTPLFGKIEDSHWFLPLYFRDHESFIDSFFSLPYGWIATEGLTNTYFAAGIAGIRSGAKRGGWLFPLYDRETSADFDEMAARIDSPTLPDEKSFDAYDSRTYFLLSDNDRYVHGHMQKNDFSSETNNAYIVTDHRKFGNILLLNRSYSRKVEYDMNTRERISDEEKSESSFLMFLYQSEHRRDTIKGDEYTCHNVLWKIWDWEEENGDVALDVFPGFTYDSRTDGYTKTSFLWRFFRYENNPAAGSTSIDFLFIPIWR